MRIFRLFVLAALFSICALPIQSAEKTQVLVVTGGHDFEPSFFTLFEGYDDIEITKAEQPKANEMYADGTAKKFDVIVLYDMWAEIAPEQRKGFVDYLNSGKGLVALHHCLGSYQNWEDYAYLIGGAYVMDKNGREIDGQHYKGSDYLHDVDMKVQVVNPNHPITRGVKDFEIHDETYKDLYVHPKANVLLQCDHPTSSPVIGWVMSHEKARVATLQLGHDSKAYANENYRKLVIQAIRWAAGK